MPIRTSCVFSTRPGLTHQFPIIVLLRIPGQGQKEIHLGADLQILLAENGEQSGQLDLLETRVGQHLLRLGANDLHRR